MLEDRVRGIRIFFSLLLLFFLLPSSAFSQKPSASSVIVNAEVDKTEALIGDRIIYTLYITADKDTEVEPPLDSPDFTPFDFVGQRGIERKEENGKMTYKIEYVLVAYEKGELETPPQTVYFKDKKGKEGEVSTDKIKIVVKGIVPKDKKDIMPEKGPIEIEVKGNKAVWVLAVISLIMAVIIIGALIYMKQVMGYSEKPFIPALTPKDMALAELDRIKGLGLVEKGDFKEFHKLISDCLKRFVCDGIHIPTSGFMTTELFKRIQGDKGTRVQDILTDCDIVKFAGYMPTNDESMDCIERAKAVMMIFR